ncbi:TIR domain-containing protein [Paenibacillus sp. MMS20-IR301]|uniref:TIR domain-containing protein n=1 Tax=Paenibacillus sp. MMS20-IR301 TaxID=2895946 RepID=UPI0028E4C480|nr:TIR domain-containing protein [Paenibacillus sp. MMS20-IR301]WNS42927.1 nucleotide-binding protein [Paenibacillus sp. MMS20-IR301]
MTRPKLFIGSSRESIRYARAIHEQLRRTAEVHPWYAAAFRANEYTMEALERNLDISDFAVFVFSPDDVARIRGKYYYVTRDNTQFEMGLFWARLRRGRVFCLLPDQVPPRSDLIPGENVEEYHLLSDLSGLTPLEYEWQHENVTAAVDVSCGKILDIIAEQGSYQDPAAELRLLKAELRRKESILHFFWQYNNNVAPAPPEEKYQALSEAVRNSFLPADNCRVTGAAMWRAEEDAGLRQVGGNVGRGHYYPFSSSEGGGGKPGVLDAFLTGEWAFLQRTEVAEVYILCYPLGKKHVLSVHFSGNEKLSAEELTSVVAFNRDLFRTVNHLVGGD